MRVIQSMDTSSNTSDEESCEEVPVQITGAVMQVSDDPKIVIAELSKKVSCLEKVYASKFQLENIYEDDNRILFKLFYTGFLTLKVCFNYLSP